MITASFDKPKLEKSLKNYAKIFGDTTAQAVIRWGVQTCRELAFETQVSGKKKTKEGTKPMPFPWVKGTQQRAIVIGALCVILIIENETGRRNKKRLSTPQQVNDWIELNRTRRGARTAKLPISDRKVCTMEVFKDAMSSKGLKKILY